VVAWATTRSLHESDVDYKTGAGATQGERVFKRFSRGVNLFPLKAGAASRGGWCAIAIGDGIPHNPDADGQRVRGAYEQEET
jgi:hypothetical protein